MYVILTLLAFGGIILFEVPVLIYRKYWRELIVFFVFLSLAFVISILTVIGITIPSPNTGISIIVKFFLKLVTNILNLN